MIVGAAGRSIALSVASTAFVKPLTVTASSIALSGATTACMTALHASSDAATSSQHPTEPSNGKTHRQKAPLTPRIKSCILMTLAMALHFGGYEFSRSATIAMFTSNSMGFSHPMAYPLAMGFVTPVSVLLLYLYGLVLESAGPRQALKTTKAVSVALLALCTGLLKVLQTMQLTDNNPIPKAVVAVLFIFQNSYAHLLYSQQWSFLGSVMTPSEGSKWFSTIAGVSSVFCAFTAALVHQIVDAFGLLGLVGGTAFSLACSMILSDMAYGLGEKHGFDPSETIQEKSTKVASTTTSADQKASLVSKTASLFKRSRTLGLLFAEVITFQSLATVLNTCFVQHLKTGIPIDAERASFNGQFYSYVNGISGIMHFVVLPLARSKFEPKLMYFLMPCMLLPLLVYSMLQTSSLWVAAGAFFTLKTMDYAIRNVVNEMVFQPMDFDSRYLGKEVIGVFANRFGKSGMSILLSLLTPFGLGVTGLSRMAVCCCAVWSCCSLGLSRLVVTNDEAELSVEKQRKAL